MYCAIPNKSVNKKIINMIAVLKTNFLAHDKNIFNENHNLCNDYRKIIIIRCY